MTDRRIIIIIVGGITLVMVTAMAVRSITADVSSEVMAQIWTPTVALVGSIVGYVFGSSDD